MSSLNHERCTHCLNKPAMFGNSLCRDCFELTAWPEYALSGKIEKAAELYGAKYNVSHSESQIAISEWLIANRKYYSRHIGE